jgi:hypothetical protein
MHKLALVCSAVLGVALLSSPAFAQQKTVKACQEEWRANKTANQAKGITEKSYVAQCRTGTSAGTIPAPAAPASSTQPKTKPTAAPAAPSRSTTPSAPAATAPIGVNQYSTEAQAKARCGSDTVVWANLDSKIYHFAGHKSYGHTKSGAYMCERDATQQGIRAAKNEKHP